MATVSKFPRQNHKSIALQEIRNKEKYPISTAEEGTKSELCKRSIKQKHYWDKKNLQASIT
jgi:hypothetical protein